MVFRRKKNKDAPNSGPSTLRGRSANHSGSCKGAGQNPLARRFLNDDEPDTIDLEEPARFQDSAQADQLEATTRLLGGDVSTSELSDESAPLDPVTGFLVIISGPGRGHVASLGYGMNSIGRDSGQRIPLDYGDTHISRKNHCVVTFDALSGKFYLQPGEGKNLVYLGADPVLVPTPLARGQNFQVGGTVLRFVALCGDDFSCESDATPPAP